MPPSLELYLDSRVVFSSAGKWLHPLFELEDFLAESGLERGALSLRDRIVGKAAALLIVRLGIRRVHAGILSRLGKEVLEAHQVAFTWDQLVEAIACRTESALARVQDADAAYARLRQLAGR
jgi:zinc transport system ATP-binding protein